MRFRNRAIPLVVLVLALAVSIPFTAAQVSGVSVDGARALFVFSQTSGLAYTQATGTPVVVNISGEDAAFAALCADTLDVVDAARPISDEEIAACAANSVGWVELLVGWDGVAVFANDPATTCLTIDALAEAFGAANAVTFGRGREYRDFFAGALGLDALGAHFTAADDDASVFAAFQPVSANALAFTSLAGALASNLTPIAIDGGDGCVAPSRETVENGAYPLGRPLYLYVNVGSGERPEVADFVDFVLSADNIARLPSLGLLPAQEASYALNEYNWSQRTTGRTFSSPPVELAEISGADLVLYDGVTEVGALVTALGDEITADHPEVQFQVATNDSDRGFARLCNGEVDLVGARRPIANAEIGVCERNGVDFVELLIGANALVFVTNRANDYATCLNVPQINQIFGAESAGVVMRWEQVQDGFPPYDLAIAAAFPPAGTMYADMFTAVRSDVAVGDVGNVVAGNEAAVGFMTYGDFLAYNARHSGALNAVAVNVGSGCVQPTEANIQNGAYPFAQPLYLYLNAESAARPAVQVLGAALLGEAGLEALNDAGLLPTTEVNYTLGRDVLQTRTSGRFFSR